MPKYLDGTGLAELCSDIKTYFTGLLASYAPKNSPALTGTPTAPTPTSGDDSTKIATTEYVQEEIRTHANLPVGFEYFSPNPNIPQGSLPLFGGEYSRATYSALWDWVQTQTGYLITDTAWQVLSNSQKGNVPFYSDGDGSTTFRVPSLKCWVKAANGAVTEVGSYLEAGLPNITGDLVPIANSGWSPNTNRGLFSTGAKTSDYKTHLESNTSGLTANQTFDASKANSIYGNSTTVQPESIVGMWLVKAYGTIVDTGTIDEQQYIDDRIAAEVTRTDGKFLPLTGGTMNGNIEWTKGAIGYRGTAHHDTSVINRQLVVSAGTVDSAWNDGNAKLCLHTYDDTGTNTAENGSFVLQASDGTNAPYLEGKPNGELIWSGNNVITSAITGNVLSASGSFSTKQSTTEACRISTHAAGVWLIVGYADLSGSSSTVYNTYIVTNNATRYTRSPGSGGGGVVNVYIATLAENEVVKFSGYLPSDATGNFRGALQMVRLA